MVVSWSILHHFIFFFRKLWKLSSTGHWSRYLFSRAENIHSRFWCSLVLIVSIHWKLPLANATLILKKFSFAVAVTHFCGILSQKRGKLYSKCCSRQTFKNKLRNQWWLHKFTTEEDNFRTNYSKAVSCEAKLMFRLIKRLSWNCIFVHETHRLFFQFLYEDLKGVNR